LVVAGLLLLDELRLRTRQLGPWASAGRPISNGLKSARARSRPAPATARPVRADSTFKSLRDLAPT
jgi:hypothetical protein